MTDNPTDHQTSNEPEFLEAAKRRKRIPVWVVPIFPLLLVWGIIYINSVTEPPASATTPDALGEELYSASCASCHGATGGGGSGPAFDDGTLTEVFTDWEDQVLWVNTGSANWEDATGKSTIGDSDTAVGTGMPGFGPLGDGGMSCEEIMMVVRYERENLGGADPDDELNELAEQVAEGDTPEIPNCDS